MGYASESGAWIREKPRTFLVRGLPIGTNTLVFRDGCPSTSRRCESRRNSPPGRARQESKPGGALVAPQWGRACKRFFIAGSVDC